MGLFEGIFLFWLLSPILAGIVASNKGRSGIGFFVLGLFFGPLALLAAAIASRDTSRDQRAAIQAGTVRHCPECAELVQSAAVRCRFCGAALVPPEFDWLGREVRAASALSHQGQE